VGTADLIRASEYAMEVDKPEPHKIVSSSVNRSVASPTRWGRNRVLYRNSRGHSSPERPMVTRHPRCRQNIQATSTVRPWTTRR
jgi:hypothetical protein